MAITLSHLTTVGNSANNTTYTFSGQSLGTEDSGRYIIVQVGGSTTGTIGVSSVTVGGISATKVIEKLHTQNTADGTSLWIAAVPTGTTGDVVVTFNSLSARCAIGLWRAVGLNSATAYDTGSGQGNLGTNPIASDTIAVESGGIIIAGAYSSNSGTTTPPTFAWTGVTENYETVAESRSVISGGLDASGTVESGKTIQVNLTSDNSRVTLVVASWSPSTGGAPAFIPKVIMY